MKNFWVRTASATVYAALTVFAIYSGQWLDNPMLGTIILSAYCLFVALGGVFEFYRMAALKGIHTHKILGYLLAILIFVGIDPFYLADEGYVALFPDYAMLAIVPAVVLAIVIVSLWRQEGNPFEEIGVTLLAPFYVALPMSLVPEIIEWSAPGMLMMIFGIIWVNDSFAYMGGSLIGRHKLWPRHSPGKTWEGCACGLLGAILLAVFVGPLLCDGIHWAFWLAIAFVCSVIGTLGDLAESMFKRSCGVKDSGKIMPGHGGFLDRFDSILASVPFIFIIIILQNI